MRVLFLVAMTVAVARADFYDTGKGGSDSLAAVLFKVMEKMDNDPRTGQMVNRARNAKGGVELAMADGNEQKLNCVKEATFGFGGDSDYSCRMAFGGLTKGGLQAQLMQILVNNSGDFDAIQFDRFGQKAVVNGVYDTLTCEAFQGASHEASPVLNSNGNPFVKKQMFPMVQCRID